MKKRIFAMVLVLTLSFMQVPAYAETAVEKAEVLYELGLIKGTGDRFSKEALELDRSATRAEICTTVVRLLGKEQKAAYQKNPHPFIDVPQWASDNIGWLYENFLVNGVSDTYFGANDIATVQQFSTMLLRVLGFSDSKGDFSYDNASHFAYSYGLVTQSIMNSYELSREAMIVMCYNALTLNIKNSERKLIKKLCDEGAINEAVAQNCGILKETTISDMFPDVPENLGEISVSKTRNRYCINFSVPVEEFGLRVYVLPEGGVLREIKLNGTDGPSFEKGKISYGNGMSAGYLDELNVYGLDMSQTYSFIVIKTSSEGNLYHTFGKSKMAVK